MDKKTKKWTPAQIWSLRRWPPWSATGRRTSGSQPRFGCWRRAIFRIWLPRHQRPWSHHRTPCPLYVATGGERDAGSGRSGPDPSATKQQSTAGPRAATHHWRWRLGPCQPSLATTSPVATPLPATCRRNGREIGVVGQIHREERGREWEKDKWRGREEMCHVWARLFSDLV